MKKYVPVFPVSESSNIFIPPYWYMRFVYVLLTMASLLALILGSGCTSPAGTQSGSEDAGWDGVPDNNRVSGEPPQDEQGAGPEPGRVTTSQRPGSDSGSPGDDDGYFSIRIVPASSLETLQKKMGPDDYLVRNDKGNIIGIVSSERLVIRGDLVQLESEDGGPGRVFDKTDVSLHLIDITFGLDNAKIGLFKSNKDYKFWFDAYYTDADVAYVKELAQQLNSLSGTTQFEDEEVALGFLQTNYEDVPYNFYNIKLVTEKMLKEFFDNRKESDRLFKNEDGELIGIVNQDYLYLTKELSDEDQRFYILKGLLYSMGLHGVSYKNSESFFYRDEGVNRELSELDTEAIRMLYGGGLKTGLTLEDTRKTLGLST